LPDSVYNWLINYFLERGLVTCFNEVFSAVAFTNWGSAEKVLEDFGGDGVGYLRALSP